MRKRQQGRTGIMIAGAARLALLVGVLLAPVLIAHQVSAGTEQIIGEAPRMSNGAGFVLLMGLQRG